MWPISGAEMLAQHRMNNTLTEIDLAADLYEFLSTAKNGRTLQHIKFVLYCLISTMVDLYPLPTWKAAMDFDPRQKKGEYVQRYMMPLWRHLEDENEKGQWINMKENQKKDEFWTKKLSDRKYGSHYGCLRYVIEKRFEKLTLQDCSDIVRILGTVIEKGEELVRTDGRGGPQEEKIPQHEQDLFKQLAERQTKHRDSKAFSQAAEGARSRARRPPDMSVTPKKKFQMAGKKVMEEQRVLRALKKPPPSLYERQQKEMKSAWQAHAGTFLEESDILAPPLPPAEEVGSGERELWKRRDKPIGGGIASFLTFDSSIVAMMDEVFGLQRGADISGTTTDHMAIIGLGRKVIDYVVKKFEQQGEFDVPETDEFIYHLYNSERLPLTDHQWHLLHMVPLATMPFAQHHTILEIALPLSRKIPAEIEYKGRPEINYHIGFYSTLVPRCCIGAKDPIALAVNKLLTWYECNRYHAVFKIEKGGYPLHVERSARGKKVKGTFGDYSPTGALVMQYDDEVELLKRNAKAIDIHQECRDQGVDAAKKLSEKLYDTLKEVDRERKDKEISRPAKQEKYSGGYKRMAICRRCGAVSPNLTYKVVWEISRDLHNVARDMQKVGMPKVKVPLPSCDACGSMMKEYV
jgi:hypothetical protein